MYRFCHPASDSLRRWLSLGFRCVPPFIVSPSPLCSDYRSDFEDSHCLLLDLWSRLRVCSFRMMPWRCVIGVGGCRSGIWHSDRRVVGGGSRFIGSTRGSFCDLRGLHLGIRLLFALARSSCPLLSSRAASVLLRCWISSHRNALGVRTSEGRIPEPKCSLAPILGSCPRIPRTFS